MVLAKCIVFVALVILPWMSLGSEGKDDTLKRFKINDNEWKRAQGIINKLVDESIASRVTEAEKDMTSLLQQNIEEHIKAKSKEYVKDLKKGCEDKIEHCDTLAAAGVCKTSKKAMEDHCARTCNLCESQYIQINPEVEIVMKPKAKSLSFVEPKAKVNTDVKAAALRNLFSGSAHSESSMEPLLSQQSSVAMKYHDNKDLTTENEKIKDAQKLLEYVKVLNVKKNKAATHETATKKHITKKPSKKSKTKKITGVPMDNLSKTVTYKNQKYKITPIVDWKKISKMLKSLGYKAIHIVGMKNKHLENGLKDHLKKNGVKAKVVTGKKPKPHVAKETFVSAVHRQKSWHNSKWFKDNCHPNCLLACVASCATGCCKEHDKIDKKTGLSDHCHPMCKTNCVPSCGSGCCTAEDEKKRGHKYLHYQKVQEDKPKPKPAPAKKLADVKPGFQVNDIHRIEKPHPPFVNPKLYSADMYKPQPRLCPGSCPQTCAPACTDECCKFGEYAQSNDGLMSGHKHNPGLVPNVPFPHKHGIPGAAYMCDETCKFHCDAKCPDNCCQPEGLIHRAARLQLPYYYNAQQQPVMGYEPAIQTLEQPGMCPAPCPSTCSPSCNVACCAAGMGMPYADQPAESRSSTRKVIHIEHILHPFDKKHLVPGSCPTYCGNHCTPVCARSGCCMK